MKKKKKMVVFKRFSGCILWTFVLFAHFELRCSETITGLELSVGSENMVYLADGTSQTLNFVYSTGDNPVMNASLNSGVIFPVVNVLTASKTGTVDVRSSDIVGASVGYGTYLLTMTLSNGDGQMTKDVVVFYEEEISNLQITVDNTFLPVDEEIVFEAMLTKGSNVELEWFLGGNETCLAEYTGLLRYASKNNTFSTTGDYTVTVVGLNGVSRAYSSISVTVQYRVHGFFIQHNEGPHNMKQDVVFNVGINTTANLEMGNVTLYVDYGDNTFDSTILTPSLSNIQTSGVIYTHQYLTQGNYTTLFTISNEIDSQTFSLDVYIWDSLTAILSPNITKAKVNEDITFSFLNPPNAGFQYHIIYGNSHSVSNTSTEILYTDFNVQPWTYSYNTPEVYTVQFFAWNPFYTTFQEFTIVVQYPIPVAVMTLTPSANEIPLPDGVQIFTLIMENNNPSPTNVSCTFDSGFDVETNISTDIEFGQPVIKTYNYTANGTYNIVFNCWNEVTSLYKTAELIVRNFTLQDFEIIYDLVVGMNMSDVNNDPWGESILQDDPVTVPFKISLFNVTRLPPDITFTWDFGDDTSTETGLISNFYKYHEFTKRGTYSVKINMTSYDNETHIVDLHIQLGAITFVSDKLMGVISQDVFRFDASGVVNGIYTFDLREGNNPTISNEPATSSVQYEKWGRKYPYVTGRNSSFIETVYSEPVFADYIISDMYIKYNESIDYPPGDITVIIAVNDSSRIFPNVTCDIFMDDFVDPGNEIVNQNISYGMELVFHYQYRTIGHHREVWLNCTNVLSHFFTSTVILVENVCFKITGIFDRQYSKQITPMVVYISDDVDLTNRMPVLCPEKGPRYDWTFETVIGDKMFEPFNKSMPEIPKGSIRFQKGEIPEGLYKVSLNVSLGGQFPTWIHEYTFIRFTKPRPYASVVGGNKRLVKPGMITVDAWTESYDAENGYGSRDTLSFTWYCYRFETNNMTELDNIYNAEIKDKNGGDYETYLKSNPAELTPCLWTLVSDGNWTLDASSLQYRGYIILVDICVMSLNISSCKSFIQQIQTMDGSPPTVNIKCVINCKEKYAVTSILSSQAICEDCAIEELQQLSYLWQLSKYNEVGDTYEEVVEFNEQTETGIDKSSIVIKANILDAGQRYKLSLSISSSSRSQTGLSEVILDTNWPPYGGSCTVEPTTGEPIKTAFIINCAEQKWLDEGIRESRDQTKDANEPLTYEYISFIRRSIDGVLTEVSTPLFKGSESTATEILLSVGDAAFDYEVIIIVRVYDYFGDVTEYNTTTKVQPDPKTIPNNTDDTQALINIMSDFNATFSTVNATGNILASVQVIGSVGSVLTSSLIPQDNETASSSDDIFKSIDGSSDPASMDFTNVDSPVRSELLQITEEFTGIFLTLIPDGTDNETALTPFDVSQVVENLDRCIANPKTVNEKSVDNVADACVRLTQNLLTDVKSNPPFPVKKLTSINEATKGVLGVIQKTIDAFLPDSFDEPSDELTEESIEQEYENYILFNNIDQSSMTEFQKSERKEKFVNYLLTQKRKEKEKDSVKINTARRNVRKIEESIQTLHKTLSSIIEFGQEEQVITKDGVEISAELASCEKFVSNSTQRRTIELQFIQSDKCTGNVELWMTYLKKPIRIYGSVASRLTSPSIRVQPRSDQNQQLSLPLEMRIDNEGVAYFRKYQPMYIENDEDEMIYFIYDIKHKEEATLLYIKPDALNFEDSARFQAAFADKDSFDLYTAFVRDDQIPRVSQSDFQHSMTVSDWSGAYGFKVFIPAMFEAGKAYIALKPIKTKEPSSAKRRRRSIGDRYFDDDIFFDVTKRRFRRSASNDTSSNVTATTTFATIDVTQFKPLDANFSVIIATTSCRTWNRETEAWVTEGCEVLTLTTLNETICRCPEPQGDVFATTFYVPPNTIDFSTVFSKFDPSNAAVYGTLLCLFVLYIIILIWARRQDKRDIERWATFFLADSDELDEYFYLITVHTGLRRGAGTKSKVYFVVSGEKADTGVRELRDGINEGFETGSARKFFMGTTTPLDDLTYLRIWHDNSGSGHHRSWYLHKLIIDDLQTNKRYIFQCDNWLSIEQGDGLVDRIVPVSSRENLMVFEKLFSGHARYNITESHLWLSLVMRPERSYFTRVQRLSCILALLLLTMIASAMFFRSSSDDTTPNQVQIGFIRFSLATLYISLISILLTTPPILLVTLIFKHVRSRQTKDEKLKTKMLIMVKSAQDELEVNKQMKENRQVSDDLFIEQKQPLPHWMVYIAWIVTILAVVTSAFFLVLYSMEWGKPKSEEWLSTFFLSFFESLFLVDPVKVIVMAVLLAILFKRPTDDKNAVVDLEKLKQASKIYNAGLSRDQANLSDDAKKKPPSSKLLRKLRRRRLTELRAYQLFFELVLYGLYAFFLYSITYIVRDDRSYGLKKHIEQHLVDGTKTLFGFSNITSHEHFFHWMNYTLFPQFFPEEDYNERTLSEREKKFFTDLDNTRLGPARLRQVRMKKGECTYSEVTPNRQCIDNYNVFEEDTVTYCFNWTPYNSSSCEYTLRPAFYYTSNAWNYTPADDIWGVSIKGEFNTYGGGGYILKFEDSLQNSILLVNELKQYMWIDRGTRAVFMEFTFYNSNVNLFTYVIFLFEFTELGGLITWTDIRAFRPYEPVGATGTYAIICYCIFMLVVLITTVKTIIKLVKEKLNFFKQFWNILDAICVVLSYVAVVIWVLRYTYAKEAMTRYYNDKTSFINFQHVVVWDFLLNVVLGFLVFVATIRILRMLGYNKKMSQLADVISTAAKDLAGFVLMFSFIFIAYALLGYLLFGSTLQEYKSVPTTFGSLANTLIGKNSLDKMIGAAPAYAQIYFFTYAFFVIFVLLTMFVAILNFSISDVKVDEKYNKKIFGIVDIVIKSVRDILALIFKMEQKKKKDVRRKKKQKPGMSDENVDENDQDKTETSKVSVNDSVRLSQNSLTDECDISVANESVFVESEAVSETSRRQLRSRKLQVYTPSDVECILYDFDEKIVKVYD